MSTVDLVPLFRRLGEEAFQTQLQKQHAFFESVLKQLPDFSRLGDQVQSVLVVTLFLALV